MNTTNTPEQVTRFNIRIGVSVTIAVLLALATLQSCKPSQYSCPSTKGMSGYSSVNPHEYQLELELDSVYVYSDNRLVGVIPYGNDGIDSLLVDDNR